VPVNGGEWSGTISENFIYPAPSCDNSTDHDAITITTSRWCYLNSHTSICGWFNASFVKELINFRRKLSDVAFPKNWNVIGSKEKINHKIFMIFSFCSTHWILYRKYIAVNISSHHEIFKRWAVRSSNSKGECIIQTL
jgi:hypothetical protein